MFDDSGVVCVGNRPRLIIRLARQYEDLVADPRSTLQKLCVFAEIPFDEAMLHHERTADERLPAASVLRHHQTSVKAVDVRKLDEWTTVLSKGEVAVFQAVAGPMLSDLGYPLVPESVVTKLRKRLLMAKFALMGYMPRSTFARVKG